MVKPEEESWVKLSEGVSKSVGIRIEASKLVTAHKLSRQNTNFGSTLRAAKLLAKILQSFLL